MSLKVTAYPLTLFPGGWHPFRLHEHKRDGELEYLLLFIALFTTQRQNNMPLSKNNLCLVLKKKNTSLAGFSVEPMGMKLEEWTPWGQKPIDQLESLSL